MRKYLLIGCLAALVAASPVLADSFIVEMKSGATFESRYQPHQSDTDKDKVMLMTGFGNWIALSKSSIKSIKSDTESRGFGTVLDSATIALGWSTSVASPDANASEEELDPTERLINYLREQNAPKAAPVFSNDLVVEPKDAGGIPVWMNNSGTAPLGNTQGSNRPN